MTEKSKIVIALDFDNQDKVMAFVAQLDPQHCRLKVGKELFTSYGPQLVSQLQALGFEVFLDLKFHDIPNTVAKAVTAAAELGVWMVNVHCSGGKEMMRAAVEALKPYGDKAPLLIGVTVLTSMKEEELAKIGVSNTSDQQVMTLAQLAQEAGLDGVVCSAQEASMLKSALGDTFILVTPGIRPQGCAAGDQHRIMTPEQAVAAGADYLVIGRPITQSSDPIATLAMINQSLDC
ncbi:MAG: orotidine-5'-phosphate decarboxylase [Ferrimonas sp.]